MRYGVIGTSWIAQSYVRGAEITGGWELGAVYSRREETGRAFAEQFGCAQVFTDLEAMAESGIDAVYIASPNSLHEEQTRLFLERGKHVLCEKPIAVSSRNLRELYRLADQKGLVYLEAIMMLHLPARRIVRLALEELGQITSAHLDFSQLSSKYGQVIGGQIPSSFDPHMAGGSLMDLGIYCVYPALDFFGLPDGISTSGTFFPFGGDVSGASLFTYKDKQVSLRYSKVGQGRLGSEIIGDQGTLVLDSISKLSGIRLYTRSGEVRELVGEPSKDRLMGYEAEDFLRYIQDPAGTREEYTYARELCVQVCEVMETMRDQAGIQLG